MAQARSDGADTALLEGGPLDGREHPIEVDTAELIVVMSDGARHRYIESSRVQSRNDGKGRACIRVSRSALPAPIDR